MSSPIDTQPPPIPLPSTDLNPQSLHVPPENNPTLDTSIKYPPTSSLEIFQPGESQQPSRPTINVNVSRGAATVIFPVFRFLLLAVAFVGGGCLLIVLFALSIAISAACFAAQGAILLLIGNAILRVAHLAHYTNNRTAAIIGVVGGAISICPLILISSCLPTASSGEQQEGRQQSFKPSWLQLIITPVFGTLSGAIGAAVLHHNHFDLKGMDILHATRAGALGGAIFGPGSILLAPIMLFVLATILSPLLFLMALGLEWFCGSVEETMTENSHSYSVRYCVGTCGRDPEVVEQMNRIDDVKRRHEDFANRTRQLFF